MLQANVEPDVDALEREVEIATILVGQSLDIQRLAEQLASELGVRAELYAALQSDRLEESGTTGDIWIVEEKVYSGTAAELRRRSLSPAVLVLCNGGLPSVEQQVMLMRMGACGFLEARCSPYAALEAIQWIQAGDVWASREVVGKALRAVLAGSVDQKLTRRESEIFERIAAGRSNSSIASELCISRDTVRWHLRCAYSKLGVHDRTQACRLLSIPPD